MMGIKQIINSPSAVTIVKQKISMAKRRTPLWFFSEDVKKKWAEGTERCWLQEHGLPLNNRRKLTRSEINNSWRIMDPESKRIYYNMSELEKVKFKEQRSLWLAEITSLFKKTGPEFDKLAGITAVLDSVDNGNIKVEEYQKSLEFMIQAQSTKRIYKDLIERVGNLDFTVPADQLISAVPENFRRILTQPRRPATPFILYASDNKDELSALRRTKYPELSFSTVASLKWHADESLRSTYEAKYESLMKEYMLAIKKFSEAGDKYLTNAMKEKRAFRKSLHKRLKGNRPLAVRNGFNFFSMDNKGLRLDKLVSLWRNMSDEDKRYYNQMAEADAARYRSERLEYDSLLDVDDQQTKIRNY